MSSRGASHTEAIKRPLLFTEDWKKSPLTPASHIWEAEWLAPRSGSLLDEHHKYGIVGTAMMVAGELLGQALTPSDHTLHLHAMLCVCEGALSPKHGREGNGRVRLYRFLAL